ncbi:MAG TPA: penicillin-binding protein 2, partial [Polymorphobacter sp.]|nr:penicillin-binding protein 2 [Polymorphobacter sp.]
DKPRYIVMATVDNPKGSKSSYGFKTAGMVVAPVVGRIVARIGPPLGIIPDTEKDIDVAALLGQIEGEAKE